MADLYSSLARAASDTSDMSDMIKTVAGCGGMSLIGHSNDDERYPGLKGILLLEF
jgi:hypothetical protein